MEVVNGGGKDKGGSRILKVATKWRTRKILLQIIIT